MNINEIPTPSYVIDEGRLEENLKNAANKPRTQNNYTLELVGKKETNIDKNYGPNIENNGTLSLPNKDYKQ